MDVFAELAITFALAVCAGISMMVVLSKLKWRSRSAARIDYFFHALVIAFVVIYTTLAFLRYMSLVTDTTDLTQYSQMTWNAVHGRPFENSLVPDAPLFLGKSFIPIMLAFVPIYAVWSDPAALLIVQVIALAAGAFPIYWYARAKTGRALGLGIAFTYLASPVVTQMLSYEFHEIAFAAPLLAYATFFLLREQYKPFLVTLAVTLLVKEEIAFVAAGLGAFIFLFQRRYRLGLALALFGVGWGALLLTYVIPFFHGSAPGNFYYFNGGWIAGGAARYSYLGNSFSEIVVTLVTRPDIVLQHLMTREKIQFVLQLVAPLAFLPLLGAEIAFLALPTLGYSLLSNFTWQYNITTAYPAPLLAFLFFAVALGLERLMRWTDSSRIPRVAREGAALVMLVAASAGNYYLYAHGLGTRGFQPEWYTLTEHSQIGNALMREIPGDAVVVAQNEFLAHLSNRQSVYEIPSIPDYRQADYLFADQSEQWFQVHNGHWNYFLNSGFFDIQTQRDGFLVARRVTPSAPRIQFGDALTLLGCAIPTTGTIQGGMTIRPVVAWQIDQPLVERYRFTVRVIDAAGHVWVTQDDEPQDNHLPTTQWRVAKSTGDQYTLGLPPTMPSGEYELTLGVHSIESDEYLQPYGVTGNEIQIASVRIEKNKGSFQASDLQIEQPLYVDMHEMRFLGTTLLPQTIHAGDILRLGLYWRARGKPQGDYLAIVQLRDSTGLGVFEQSARPANGTYPTMEWNIGEVLLDWHDMTMPANLAVGKYQIVVLLRDAATGALLGETGISWLSVVNP